jgi:hypothetical protein
MMRWFREGRTVLPVLSIGCLILAAPRTSHAYSHEAAAAIVARIPGALPPAARWSSDWSATAAAQVERTAAAESDDPERDGALHRFVAGDAAPEVDDPVRGLAPFELVDAHDKLRQAFRARQLTRIIDALDRIAVSAADLADPFQMTSLERDEVLGARLRYSDELGEPTLRASLATLVPGATPLAGALEMAVRSAAQRDAIEAAYGRGDVATLDRIRDERLATALVWASGLVIDAWTAAGSPALDAAAPRDGEARVWPNPARTAATLSFTLPGPGAGRIELYDVAGRKVWASPPTALPGGPQEFVLGPAALSSLPPGLYLARITTPAAVATGRLFRVAP